MRDHDWKDVTDVGFYNQPTIRRQKVRFWQCRRCGAEVVSTSIPVRSRGRLSIDYERRRIHDPSPDCDVEVLKSIQNL